MDESAFDENSPGRLVPTGDGVMAFLPHALPDRLDLPAPVARRLGAAYRRIGELVEGVRTLPAADLLIRPIQKREAVLSSRIEGTETTLEEAFFDDATGVEPTEIDDDRLEVRNYERALQDGVQALQKGQPLSTYLLRSLHATLLTGGVRGEAKQPGRFRTEQVYLGNRAGGIERARFVPPPPVHVEPCLEEMQAYLDAKDTSEDDPLVRVALTHYQFETIHPFYDGNGRVGRLLVALQLVHERVMNAPWLFVSSALEAKRDDYYDHLLLVSTKGTFLEWVEFFLGAVVEAAEDTVDRVHRLRELHTGFTERLKGLRTQLPIRLAHHLFSYPLVTAELVSRLLGPEGEAPVPMPTAQAQIKALQKAGILQEHSTIKRRSGPGRSAKVYRCGEILDALAVS